MLLLDDPIVAATVEVQSRGRNVFRLFHTKCQKREKGKSLYICLGCGEQSAHSARRLVSTSCNCMQESPTHSSTSSLGHKGNPKPRCGAEELLGCKENDWPSASQKYFLREHHQVGDGKRGLVYNSLVDWRRRTGFEGLSDEEVHHHLHITNIHHGITASKSKDVCQLTADLVDEGSQHRKGAENAMRIAFEETIMDVLQRDGNKSSSEIKLVMNRMNRVIDEKLKEYDKSLDKQQLIDHPKTHSKIRKAYTQGPKSILANLPMPKVTILNGCAYISAKQIVNHLLALGLEVQFFRVGFPEDWLVDGDYVCGFIKEVHDQVKEAMTTNQALSPNTRVAVIRVWSDGFEAHHIITNTDFNSLQLFTLTLRAPVGKRTKHHTWPFALCFKKNHSRDIFIQLLQEVNELRRPTLRYWGQEKRVHETMVFLDMISNDLPERCYNTGTSFLGTYTHRWCWSCIYEDNWTPSCRHCELHRVNNILFGRDGDAMTRSCDKCSDWWSPSREHVHTNAEVYPITPADLYTIAPEEKEDCPIPAVELSFEMMENSIDALQEWYQQEKNGALSKVQLEKAADDYLHRLGVSQQFVPGLSKDFANGIPMKKSSSYPEILKKYRPLSIKLNKFETMPMHMCFLGCSKNLISISPIIVHRRMKDQNEFWHSLTNSMQSTQKLINSISIDWCMSMSFSGKNLQSLGTSTWQSDHYLAFTRLCLFHFAPLEGRNVPESMTEVIAAFKRVFILWFCLMSSVYGDDKVSSSKIDNYVKLFLSSCRFLWIFADKGTAMNKKKDTAKKKK